MAAQRRFLLTDLRRDHRIGAGRTAAARDALLDPAVMRRPIERFCGEPPPGDGLPESMAELMARELEVLKLVARGLSNRQIGESLFLSEATVTTHSAHAHAKLSARDRVQPVVLAHETGLVHPGERVHQAARTSQPATSHVGRRAAPRSLPLPRASERLGDHPQDDRSGRRPSVSQSRRHAVASAD